MPNGEKLDVSVIQLLESSIIGDRDTHILNLKGVKLERYLEDAKDNWQAIIYRSCYPHETRG
jgi:hypothetical protein